MPRSDRPGRPQRVWRILLSVLAAGLGLAALYLIVFGNTQRQLQFGVLLALWSAATAAFLYGPRFGHSEQAVQLAEAERRAHELHEAQLQVSHMQQQQLAAAEELRSRQEVELRKIGEMQLSREAAARREADLHLEISLRREIERMMNEQIGLLRDEVAALRAEVVDKLGGQLRLERIETTRLIGSDLEALQHEIRRLAGSQESIAVGRPSLNRGQVHRDIVDAEVVEAEEEIRVEQIRVEPAAAPPPPASVSRAATAPAAPAAAVSTEAGATVPPAVPVTPAETHAPPPASPQPAAAQAAPTWSEPTVVNPDPLSSLVPPQRDHPSGKIPPLYKQSEQVAAFTSSFDPFAGLPRLSPVPEDLDLIDDEETDSSRSDDVSGPTAGDHSDPSAAGYAGRRRADGSEVDAAPAASSGGGRRRAPDDAPDDLLARLHRS